jgi:transposase
LTIKIHMLVDTFGRPLRFYITLGQASDIRSAADFLENQRAEAVLADKAHASNALRETITAMKVKRYPLETRPQGLYPTTSTSTNTEIGSNDASIV